MKQVLCPPCGTVFEANTEDEVVRAAQEHAKAKHAYDLSREEVLAAAKTLPFAGDQNAVADGNQ